MSKARITPLFAAFAGVVGAGAYVWTQQHPEETHRLVEHTSEELHHLAEKSKQELQHIGAVTADIAEKGKHVAGDLIEQVKTTSGQLTQDAKSITEKGISATTDALHKAEKSLGDLTHSSGDVIHQAKEAGEHLIHDVKQKIDVVVQDGAGKPGLLDQLKQHTGGLLHPKDSAAPVISKSPVAVSESLSLSKPSSSAGGASGKLSLLDFDNYSTAITALIVAHVAFIFWHKDN